MTDDLKHDDKIYLHNWIPIPDQNIFLAESTWVIFRSFSLWEKICKSCFLRKRFRHNFTLLMFTGACFGDLPGNSSIFKSFQEMQRNIWLFQPIFSSHAWRFFKHGSMLSNSIGNKPSLAKIKKILPYCPLQALPSDDNLFKISDWFPEFLVHLRKKSNIFKGIPFNIGVKLSDLKIRK